MNTLDLNRIKQLLLHHIEQEKQAWLITAAVIAAVTIIPALVLLIVLKINIPGIVSESMGSSAPLSDWIGIYILAGILFTSRLFRTLHQPGTAWQTLMMPASTREKWLAAWLISVPLYSAAFLILTLAIGLLQNLFSLLIIGETFPLSTPFSQGFLFTLFIYIFVSSIYLWGSIRFKSLHFLKTSLWIAAVYVGLAITGTILIYIAYKLIGPGSLVEAGQELSNRVLTTGFSESIRLARIFVTFFTGLIATVILWRSYAGLVKKEVI